MTELSLSVLKSYPEFNHTCFVEDVIGGFKERELKQRIAWIREQLFIYLPKKYPTALKIILDSLPEELDPHLSDNDFGSFIIAPLSDYVATYGCTNEYLDVSLQALKEITKRFSVEFAIRTFINTYPEETFIFLMACAVDDNYHVRRLASEGSRPSLPWAQNIGYIPEQTFEILDLLFSDTTRYVTRSVANHINDISKKDPDLVIKKFKEWKNFKKQNPQEMKYIIRHGLRTLVKKNNIQALAMLGYKQAPPIVDTSLSLDAKKVAIGSSCKVLVSFSVLADIKLLIMYELTYAHPKRQSKKVFKVADGCYKKREQVMFSKKQSMNMMTTKTLHLGIYTIELFINGVSYGSTSFELIAS